MGINKKRVGEWLITQEEITPSKDNPYFDLTSNRQLLSINNWPDLVSYHRNQKFKFGGETKADIIEVTFYPGEAHLLLNEDEFSTNLTRSIYEDQQYHYTYEGGNADTWNRSITLPNDLKINDTTIVPAGDYRIKRAEFSAAFLATGDVNALHSGVVLQIESKENFYHPTNLTLHVVDASNSNKVVYQTGNYIGGTLGTANPGYVNFIVNSSGRNHLVAKGSNDYNFGTGDFTIDIIAKAWNTIFNGSRWMFENCEPDERRYSWNDIGSPAGMADKPVIIGDKIYYGLVDGNIAEVDIETLIVQRKVDLGTGPMRGMTYDGTWLWVAQTAANSISKIDLSNFTVSGTITVGASPYSMSYLSGFVYVANQVGHSVSKVDTVTHGVSGTLTVGNTPVNIIYDENGYLWTVNNSDDTVSYIDVSNFTLSGSVGVGDEPNGVEYHNGYIYTANFLGNSISRVNVHTKASGTITDSHTALNNPKGIIKTPENLLLISEYSSDRVRVFDIDKQVFSKYWTALKDSVTDAPWTLAVHSGMVIVASTLNNNIVKMPYATNWINFSYRGSAGNAGFGTYLSGKVYIPLNNSSTPAQIAVLDTNRGFFDSNLLIPHTQSSKVYQTIVVNDYLFATATSGVVKIDPATSGVVGTFIAQTPYHNKTINYDGNYLWVTNEDNRLYKISPNTMIGEMFSYTDAIFGTGSVYTACVLSGYLFVCTSTNQDIIRISLDSPYNYSLKTSENFHSISCDDNYLYAVKASANVQKFDPTVEDWSNAVAVEKYGLLGSTGYLITRDTVNNTGFWVGNSSTSNANIAYMDGRASWNIPVGLTAYMNVSDAGSMYTIPGDSNYSYVVNYQGSNINVARIKSGPKTTYGIQFHVDDEPAPIDNYSVVFYGGPGKVLTSNSSLGNLTRTSDSPSSSNNFYTRISRKNNQTNLYVWGQQSQFGSSYTNWPNLLRLHGIMEDSTNYNSNHNLYIGGNTFDQGAVGGSVENGPQTTLRYLSINKGTALSFSQSEYAFEPRIVISYADSLKINGNDTLITINGKGDRSKYQLRIADSTNFTATNSIFYLNKSPSSNTGIKIFNGFARYGSLYGNDNKVLDFNTLGSTWIVVNPILATRQGACGVGTKNAGLIFAGNGPLSSSEHYNGTSWSVGGSLSTARYLSAGVGTQNAALAAGGFNGGYLSSTEEYNGVSWSAGGTLGTARNSLAGAGTQNAALAVGGFNGSYLSSTEEYNGTSWSAGGTLGTARYALGGAGTQDAALAVSGFNGSYLSSTEEYNGTSWLYGGNITTVAGVYIGQLTGSQNAALQAGGYAGSYYFKLGQKYNGVSWAITAGLNITRHEGAGFGNQSSSIIAGGNNGGSLASTEEYIDEYEALILSSWTAGGNLITARYQLAGAGTQTAGLAFGGAGPLSSTEEYDGATWSAGGSLGISRDGPAGAGTQTAALATGGNVVVVASTEHYNGISWTAGGVMLNGRYLHASAGSQSAALIFGGASGGVLSSTEEYDGASWAIGGNLITARYQLAGAGTQNAALAFGGTGPLSSTEEYDGATWSAGGSLLASRFTHGGNGTMSSALAVAGTDSVAASPLSSTEKYNGTTWYAGSSLSRRKAYAYSIGSQSSALSFGGYDGVSSSSTEEYTNIYETLVLGAWSAGGSLNTARRNFGGAGTQTAGLAVGGDGGSYLSSTEEYNGSNWSLGGNLNYGGDKLRATGLQTAALAVGGFSGVALSITEEYDGASWAIGGNLIAARYDHVVVGTQNAALATSGSDDSFAGYTLYTEEYNGTSWALGGGRNYQRYSSAGAGTQNDAIIFGGRSGAINTASTEQYNGVTWSPVNDMHFAITDLSSAGTRGSALAIGGNSAGADLNLTQKYDGISWYIGSSLLTARDQHAGAGTQSSALAFGGYDGSYLSSTEEYTSTRGAKESNQDFTIQFWVNIYDVTNPGCLISKTDSNHINSITWGLFYDYQAPAGVNKVFSNLLRWKGRSYSVDSSNLYNILKAGKWNHIGISRTGNELSVYLNGTRIINHYDDDVYNMSNNDLIVGSSNTPNSANHHTDIYIDEIRIDKDVGLFTGETTQYQLRGQLEFYPKRVSGDSTKSIHYPFSDTYIAINGDYTGVGLRSRANVGRHDHTVSNRPVYGINLDESGGSNSAGGPYRLDQVNVNIGNMNLENEYTSDFHSINKPKTTGVKIYEWAGRYKP